MRFDETIQMLSNHLIGSDKFIDIYIIYTQPSSRRFLGVIHFAKKRREVLPRREVLIYCDASRQIYHFAKKARVVP